MSVTCSEIAALGTALISQSTEVAERSGVSRLYYGALHRTKEWLGTVPGVPGMGGSGGTHAQLQHSLKTIVDKRASDDQKKKGRMLAVKLGVLKGRRSTADYDLTAPCTAGEVLAQSTQTAELFTYCDAAP